MVAISSPMPNRPMTATRKLTPLTRSGSPNVSRSDPEIVSMPTAASEKPMPADTRVLNGEAPPRPTKQAKARK